MTGNIGNVITGENSGKINFEQLPEILAIGDLLLPEKMSDELIW